MGLPGVGFALAPWLEREAAGVGPQATPAAATALLQHCKAEPRGGNKGSHEPLDFWTRARISLFGGCPYRRRIVAAEAKASGSKVKRP